MKKGDLYTTITNSGIRKPIPKKLKVGNKYYSINKDEWNKLQKEEILTHASSLIEKTETLLFNTRRLIRKRETLETYFPELKQKRIKKRKLKI